MWVSHQRRRRQSQLHGLALLPQIGQGQGKGWMLAHPTPQQLPPDPSWLSLPWPLQGRAGQARAGRGSA